MQTHVQLPKAVKENLSQSSFSADSLTVFAQPPVCVPLFMEVVHLFFFLEMNCTCDRFQFPCHLECHIPSLKADLECVLCFCVYKPEKNTWLSKLGILNVHAHTDTYNNTWGLY